MNPIQWDLGDGIVVRTLTPDDDVELFELVEANRERLRPWMPWEPDDEGPADTRAFIERSRWRPSTTWRATGSGSTAAWSGTIGLRVDPMDAEGRDRLLDRRRRRGTRDRDPRVRAVLTFAFEELGLHRVELYAATGTRAAGPSPNAWA